MENGILNLREFYCAYLPNRQQRSRDLGVI